jgi:hypothetical protein
MTALSKPLTEDMTLEQIIEAKRARLDFFYLNPEHQGDHPASFYENNNAIYKADFERKGMDLGGRGGAR